MNVDQRGSSSFEGAVQVIDGDNIELLSDSRNDSVVDFERFINRVHFGCTLFLYTVDQEIAGMSGHRNWEKRLSDSVKKSKALRFFQHRCYCSFDSGRPEDIPLPPSESSQAMFLSDL